MSLSYAAFAEAFFFLQTGIDCPALEGSAQGLCSRPKTRARRDRSLSCIPSEIRPGCSTVASRVNMGNKSSVLPNESDGARETKQPKAQPRRKESYTEATPTPKAPRPRRRDNSGSISKATDVKAKALDTTKPAEVSSSTPKRTEPVATEAADSRAAALATDSGSTPKGSTPTPKADSESGLRNSQDGSGLPQTGKSQETDGDQGWKHDVDDHQERKTTRGSGEYHARRGGSREEETVSEEHTSGSSDSGSYTSSSYSSGSEESDDDEASDDTFFVPEVSL